MVSKFHPHILFQAACFQLLRVTSLAVVTTGRTEVKIHPGPPPFARVSCYTPCPVKVSSKQ